MPSDSSMTLNNDPTDTPEEESSYSSTPSETKALSTVLLRALADYRDTSLSELDPLYNQIDLEALDALFAAKHEGTSRATGEVSFALDGKWVTIRSNRTVEIEPRTEDTQ